MDSLTHIALGAVIGEAYAGKSLGKKALVIGAAAQSLPDIDFIASFFLSPVEDLLAHRGITHSILFAVIMTVALAYAANRWLTAKDFSLKHWMIFLGLEIFMHFFLDSLNSYGTGFFEPFSHARYSFNVIFVADPLFTIWLLIAMIVLIRLPMAHSKRLTWAYTALAISASYMIFSISNKLVIHNRVEKSFASQTISPKQYFTSPTAFNNLLWYVVIETDSGFHIGYTAVFDSQKNIDYVYFPQNTHLLKGLNNQDEINGLIRFSQGYYTIEKVEEVVVFNDLRFGQIAGWNNPQSKFVFYYFLDKPNENLMVVQRGRLTGWNKKTIKSLFTRMAGN